MTREEISTFRTGDGFYELRFSEAEMSDAFNGGFLDAIARVLEIINEEDQNRRKELGVAYDSGSITVADRIRSAVLALVEDKTERVYRVHSKPDKVFKTQAERDAYIYGYGDGHEDGCSDGREQALEIIDEVKSDANKGYMFDMVNEIKNRVLALQGGDKE